MKAAALDQPPIDSDERLRRILETQRDVVAADLDLNTVMNLICEQTQELTGADSGSILMLDGEHLVHRAATGFVSAYVGEQLRLDDTFSGSVYRNNRSAICADTKAIGGGGLAFKRGIRSLIAVPLRHRGEAVGLLTVLSRTPNSFTAEDLNTLELLAVVLASVMSHASEFEALGRFRTIFQASSVGIVRVDREGRLVEANPAMERMLGYTASELATMSFQDYTHPEDIQRNLELFTEMMAGDRESFQLEKRYFRRDGEMIWGQITAALERDSEGQPRFAVSMVENITERKAAEEALRRQSELNEYQALHDGLTGLPNRTLFYDRIRQAVLTAGREGGRVAVMMMDVDRFKEINDSLGHHVGDALLEELSRRLQDVLRTSDTVARLGGDEFGLLLPQHCEPADVRIVLERICESVEEPIMLEGMPLTIEASIGVAFWPENGQDVETLLQHADTAMYKAKEENVPHVFYEDVQDSYDPTRLRLVGELHRALEQHQLVLYFQPKVRLADGEVDSLEALVRWNHPRLGLVPPDDFIPLAEQTGLIKPLTQYVVAAALQQYREWQLDGLELPIAVNLSTRTLRDLDFPTHVRRLLESAGLDGSVLQFEITESAMIADPARSKTILDKLASFGIRLSIDDFGTGYSSLAYLKRLPVHEIKIDRSFVMHMDVDENDATIVRSTIELARNLGLDIVAEGVESERIWQQLQELECTIAQGYHLTRPVPAAALRDWLRRYEAAPAGGRTAPR
ncbi:MAG: putative bifunctional diguanylate cyclase/phosphodiesterase [Gaiellaceae bacterium]